MKNDFETLLEFLGRCGPEASGRECASPTPAEAEKLRRLATGVCEKKERAEIFAMLQHQPGLLRWLAEQVRFARTPDGPNGSETVPI